MILCTNITQISPDYTEEVKITFQNKAGITVTSNLELRRRNRASMSAAQMSSHAQLPILLYTRSQRQLSLKHKTGLAGVRDHA